MSYRGRSNQEHFVLNVLKEKKEGYYVELGAYHATEGSNTFYLETDYDWKGVAFEINPKWHEDIVKARKNECVLGDATQFNYIKYFEENNFPKQIDYLQVDIDGGYDEKGNSVGNPYLSLHGLIALPLNQYRFSVITFEHDANIEYKNLAMRDAQREILHSLGYKMVVRDLHEDWWVDPNVIPYMEYREFYNIRSL